MRRFFAASALTLLTAAMPVTGAYASPSGGSPSGDIPIDVAFSWDGAHGCVSARSDSVTCVSGEADVPGIGHVEYARDAVPNGKTTPDGCAEYSTHGTIWIDGGTAEFDGAPANDCGGPGNPDAHYTYTIHGGAGVLAGARGTGDIVANSGVDTWRGDIRADGLRTTTARASSSSTAVVAIAVGAGVLVVAGAVVVVARRRRGRAAGADTGSEELVS